MSCRTDSRRSCAARFAVWLVLFASAVSAVSGCVEERCYANSDCKAPRICLRTGYCGYECSNDTDCGPGMQCSSHTCQPLAASAIECPADMVKVGNGFCIDRFEASRPDATGSSAGQVEDAGAVSQPGVLPWEVPDNATARAACQQAGKDLCSPQQWSAACEGPGETVYGYGDTYEPATCNGIDRAGISGFGLLPTGAMPECRNGWGAFDMNGNLWEHVLGGDNTTVRGGAYNCKDSQTLHRCDYVPGNWEPAARGFRCCLIPTNADAGVPVDASLQDATPLDASTDQACATNDASDDAPSDAPTPDVAWPDVIDSSSDTPAGQCPEDMVLIGSFCMDIYEASRFDATSDNAGSIPVATSRAGVLPWQGVDLEIARAGCNAAGKRLCRLDEWIDSCGGPEGWAYSYGDHYDPAICNGIDTYCRCESASCAPVAACPYPHCYDISSPEGGGPCGADFQVLPTGSLSGCHNSYGVFDITGNVWELTDSNDGLLHFRGGAYNCTDSEALHRCDHDGIWGPSARGFRCCKDPS